MIGFDDAPDDSDGRLGARLVPSEERAKEARASRPVAIFVALVGSVPLLCALAMLTLSRPLVGLTAEQKHSSSSLVWSAASELQREHRRPCAVHERGGCHQQTQWARCLLPSARPASSSTHLFLATGFRPAASSSRRRLPICLIVGAMVPELGTPWESPTERAVS